MCNSIKSEKFHIQTTVQSHQYIKQGTNKTYLLQISNFKNVSIMGP